MVNIAIGFAWFPDSSKFIQIFLDKSRFTDVSRLIKIYPELSRFIQIYPELSRIIRNYPELSRFIQIYPDVSISKIILKGSLIYFLKRKMLLVCILVYEYLIGLCAIEKNTNRQILCIFQKYEI